MKANLVAAIILAIGLVLAGLAAGGRYSIVRLNDNAVARLDRLTGAVVECSPNREQCGWVYID